MAVQTKTKEWDVVSVIIMTIIIEEWKMIDVIMMVTGVIIIIGNHVAITTIVDIGAIIIKIIEDSRVGITIVMDLEKNKELIIIIEEDKEENLMIIIIIIIKG